MDHRVSEAETESELAATDQTHSMSPMSIVTLPDWWIRIFPILPDGTAGCLKYAPERGHIVGEGGHIVCMCVCVRARARTADTEGKRGRTHSVCVCVCVCVCVFVLCE